jgi:hypothetical protein
MSPLARLRYADRLRACPFIGVDRKQTVDGQNDANDPERSLLEASSREPAREWQQQDRSSLPYEAGPVSYPRRGRITPSKACTSASGIS